MRRSMMQMVKSLKSFPGRLTLFRVVFACSSSPLSIRAWKCQCSAESRRFQQISLSIGNKSRCFVGNVLPALSCTFVGPKSVSTSIMLRALFTGKSEVKMNSSFLKFPTYQLWPFSFPPRMSSPNRSNGASEMSSPDQRFLWKFHSPEDLVLTN